MTGFAGRVLGWYPTGQLRSVGWSGQALTFGYDASGQRLGYNDSVEAGIRYTLRGLSGQVLREYFELNGSWSWVKDHVWAGGELLAAVEPTGTKHVHRDHLGSVRVETSGTGAVVATHSYWPFGEEMTVTSSSERYRFAGHERDQRTGYDSMHARYYAPMAGRFFSPDPVRGDPTQPQSLNLYAYVMNDPVNLVDPMGLLSREAMGSFSEGVTVTAADPCPSAPKAMDCSTWENLMNFWYQAWLNRLLQNAVPARAAQRELMPSHVPDAFYRWVVEEAETNELLAYELYGPEGVPGLEPVEGPLAALLAPGGAATAGLEKGVFLFGLGAKSAGRSMLSSQVGKNISGKKLVKLLEGACSLVTQARGSSVVLELNGSQSLGKGLLNEILKDLGLE